MERGVHPSTTMFERRLHPVTENHLRELVAHHAPGPCLSLYVALPVAATVLYSQPSIMNQIISFFNYTVYPPAGPPPPGP